MTDGPHKSLPLKRPFKKLAEKAWNPATPPEEIGEQWGHAFATELDPGLCRYIGNILEGGPNSLFANDPSEMHRSLEELRQNYGGSFSAGLIDWAQCYVARGQFGQDALFGAVADFYGEGRDRFTRQITDHYIQLRGREGRKIHDRLTEGFRHVDSRQTISLVMTGQSIKRQFRPSPKDGTEMGPPL